MRILLKATKIFIILMIIVLCYTVIAGLAMTIRRPSEGIAFGMARGTETMPERTIDEPFVCTFRDIGTRYHDLCTFKRNFHGKTYFLFWFSSARWIIVGAIYALIVGILLLQKKLQKKILRKPTDNDE